jgi:hypothetical protein
LGLLRTPAGGAGLCANSRFAALQEGDDVVILESSGASLQPVHRFPGRNADCVTDAAGAIHVVYEDHYRNNAVVYFRQPSVRQDIVTDGPLSAQTRLAVTDDGSVHALVPPGQLWSRRRAEQTGPTGR